MTVEEVRAIRERKSLETTNMTAKELRAYFAEGADKAEKRIAEIRREKGIEFKPASNE